MALSEAPRTFEFFGSFIEEELFQPPPGGKARLESWNPSEKVLILDASLKSGIKEVVRKSRVIPTASVLLEKVADKLNGATLECVERGVRIYFLHDEKVAERLQGATLECIERLARIYFRYNMEISPIALK